MKVLLVEHNIQESRCLSVLAEDDTIEQVKLGAPNMKQSTAAVKELGYDNVLLQRVNATNPDSVAAAAKGVDMVIDMTAPWISSYVKKGSLQANTSYVNPKENSYFWDSYMKGRCKLQNVPCIVIPQTAVIKHK